MLKKLFRIFSLYIHPVEKRADKLFRSVNKQSDPAKVKRKLLSLIQSNLAVLNLWIEKEFKGYKGLGKRKRRALHANLKLITKNFRAFIKENPISQENLDEKLLVLGEDFNKEQKEKLHYLMQIMAFLQPGQYYEYLETASFHKLLTNIDAGKQMIGDCNQIVTFYIYLYSLNYKVQDLKLKLIPGHVALHFAGIDIEATSAKFHKYQEYDQVVPVTEIISTNLLDLNDYREKTYEVSQRHILKSAQLAFLLSSKRQIVEHNLIVAYKNLAIKASQKQDFDAAIFFAQQSKDQKLLRNTYHNAAIYFSKKHKFKKAIYYAGEAHQPKLSANIKQQEAVYYYQKGNLDKALGLAEAINNQDLQKAIYSKKYNALYQQVKKLKTLKDQKRYRSTYKRMYKLAKLMQNQELTSQINSILKKI